MNLIQLQLQSNAIGGDYSFGERVGIRKCEYTHICYCNGHFLFVCLLLPWASLSNNWETLLCVELLVMDQVCVVARFFDFSKMMTRYLNSRVWLFLAILSVSRLVKGNGKVPVKGGIVWRQYV